MFEPNDHQRLAAKYAKKAKICFAVTIVGFVLLLLACFLIKSSAPWTIFCFLPFFSIMALGFYYQKQEIKLRCTKRTTARCIKTVCRHSGKSIRRYPIVEFEVDGMPYTAELSVSCSRHAEGELYTIYYDPLDPKTVRTEERTWLR